MPTRPHILLLHCHDLGRFLGCYGVPTVTTPALDGLAAQGLRFERAFCTAPQCSPSRASLFTGRYPQQHGVLGLTHADFGWDLRPGERHLAAMLRERGYATALHGVHHESRIRSDREVAERLGFDEVVTGGLAPAVAERAVARLAALADGERPFYLQVGFHEPHRSPSPRDAPGTTGFLSPGVEPDHANGVTVPPYLLDTEGTRTELAELQGAVRLMDAAVGTVLSGVHRLGLDDDTIVVFTTDHGLALPRAKCTLYDPGIEVALIVRDPRHGPVEGQVISRLVSNVDIVPTLLDAAGAPIPDSVAGRNLHPDRPRDRVFAQLTHHDYYDPRRCVRTENRKLIVNFSSAPSIMDASQSWHPRSTPAQLEHGWPPYHPPVEMYDLDGDPAELANIADRPDRAAERAELLASLAGWMRAVDDPLLTGAVPSPVHERSLALLRER